jgi:hypothetical protein
MGNQFAPAAEPNCIVLLQQGGGANGGCGPARFDPDHAAADTRLLARVAPDEVRAKITSLNSEMRRFRNPCCFILPAVLVGLLVMAAIQIAFFAIKGEESRRKLSSGLVCPRGLPRTTKVDKLIWPDEDDRRKCGDADTIHDKYCSEAENKPCYEQLVRQCCGYDNACKGRRACERHEASDPYANSCCNFYCCKDDTGSDERSEPWDMKGPHWVESPHQSPECLSMRPVDRIFRLSGSAWEDSKFKVSSNLYAEPWFNETLSLGAYVQGGVWGGKRQGPTMDLGCNCNVHKKNDQEWYAVCDKMIVTGDFRSERWPEGHEYESRYEDEYFWLDILRYMGGGVVFIFLIPALCCMCEQRKRKQQMIVEFFADWVRRGIVVRVSYFPGSKHAQARLTLYLPPYTNPGIVMANGGGGAAVEMVLVPQAGAHVIQPPRGLVGGGGGNAGGAIQVLAQPGQQLQRIPVATDVVVSSNMMPLVQQRAAGNQVVPVPVAVPTIPK